MNILRFNKKIKIDLTLALYKKSSFRIYKKEKKMNKNLKQNQGEKFELS